MRQEGLRELKKKNSRTNIHGRFRTLLKINAILFQFSGEYCVPFPSVYRDLSLGIKQPDHEANH
jgi:hypothetical protein